MLQRLLLVVKPQAPEPRGLIRVVWRVQQQCVARLQPYRFLREVLLIADAL